MQAFILSANDALSVRIRQCLLQHGQECPAAHVLTLDQASQRLAQEHPELLVVVLSPDPLRALAVLGEPDLPPEPRVVPLPRLNDEDWATVLAGARALCYPTRYEGFGLPALEAAASGTPAASLTALIDSV